MDNNQEQLKDVAKKIEVILFYLNDSVTIKELASYLDLDRDIILGAIPVLKQDLVDRPITLVLNGEEVSIGTKPEFSGIIEKMMKEEMEKDLTQASLDTLSIILYKSPITKKEIEYIRGVNSSFSIRNLLVRGLIDRESSKLDDRVYLYKPSLKLFNHLGISKIEDMPEWKALQEELKTLVDSEQVKSDNNTDN